MGIIFYRLGPRVIEKKSIINVKWREIVTTMKEGVP
jgi:hypothetical protein